MARGVTVTAVVLAGSRPGVDPLAARFGTDLKALVPVGGEPMVRRPVRALLASEHVGDVIVLAQEPERIAAALPDDRRIRIGESRSSIAATLLEICGDQATRWPLLVTTADHALLDTAIVDEFVGAAAGSDIAVAVVERSALLRRLPAAKRTWLKFRGGTFTGANLFLLGGPQAASAIELWRSAEQERKKGRRLLALLGPVVVAGTLLRLLSIDDVLARVGGKLGLSVRAARMNNPLAGVDVDKPEDHALAEAILKGRA